MGKDASGWSDKIPLGKENVAEIIAASAGFTIFGLIIDRGLGFATRIVLARSLTPSEYGLLFLAFSVLSIAITISVFSLGDATARYVAYYRGKNDYARVKGTVLSALKISVPFSVLAFFALFFFSEPISIYIFHEPAMASILKVFSFAVLFTPAARILMGVTTAFHTVKYVIYAQGIAKTVLTLAILMVLLWLGFGLNGAAIAYLMGYVAMFFLIVYFIQRGFPVLKMDIKAVPMKRKVFSFAWPLLISGIIWNFNGEMGTLLLGVFRGSEDVGIFQSALPNAQLLLILPAAIMALFLPIATTMLAQGKTQSIKKMFRTAFKWVFYLNFPVFVILFFYPNAVINLLFGAEYMAAGPVLSMLSVALFLCPLNISATMLLIHGKTRFILINGLVAISINVILNYILVPMEGPFGGAVGAAIAMTAMFLTLHILCIIEAYRISGIFCPNVKVWRSALAGFVGLLFIFSMDTLIPSMPVYMLLSVLAGFFLIYSIALLVFGGLERDDAVFLRLIEKKTGFRSEKLRNLVKRFI